MSIERSRTAIPVVDQPRGLTMGSWAMWITLTALSTGIAGLAAAVLYLHSGQPAWPPAPLARPSVLYAVTALALAAGGSFLLHRAKVQLRSAQERAATGSLLAGGAVLTAAVVTLGLDLANAGFRWDVHAYTSMYWVNTTIAAIFVGVGVLMVAAVTVQRLIGVLDAERMLELEITVGYLWWSVGAAAAILAVTHLLPDPAGGTAAALVVLP